MDFYKNENNLEQAHNVSTWIEKDDKNDFSWVIIFNESNFPISKVILTIVNIQGEPANGLNIPKDYRVFLTLAPPGKSYTKIRIHHGMNFLSGVEMAFKDKDGKNWIKNGAGILTRIQQSPINYYGITLPVSWEYPKDKIDN